jgi:hypothetical protein
MLLVNMQGFKVKVVLESDQPGGVLLILPLHPSCVKRKMMKGKSQTRTNGTAIEENMRRPRATKPLCSLLLGAWGVIGTSQRR